MVDRMVHLDSTGSECTCILIPCGPSALAETDLEDMAMHETEENKVFQRFKKKIASEPHQVQKSPNFIYTLLRPSTVLSHPGDSLLPGRISSVGLRTARPLRSGHPIMHLWC